MSDANSMVLTSAELMEWREIVHERLTSTSIVGTAVSQADAYIREADEQGEPT